MFEILYFVAVLQFWITDCILLHALFFLKLHFAVCTCYPEKLSVTLCLGEFSHLRYRQHSGMCVPKPNGAYLCVRRLSLQLTEFLLLL